MLIFSYLFGYFNFIAFYNCIFATIKQRATESFDNISIYEQVATSGQAPIS